MPEEPAPRRLQWWLVPLVCCLVAAGSLIRAGAVAWDQVAAPFDLHYETPNLRTIQLIQAGRNVYDPGVYAAPPFWITIYTPLYHHVGAFGGVITPAGLPTAQDAGLLALQRAALASRYRVAARFGSVDYLVPVAAMP